MKHVFSALLRDEPRALTRCTSLFARRGFNIVSLSVGNTEIPGVSRMTFIVEAPAEMSHQIEQQLAKIEDVIKVLNHAHEKFVDRELVLVKVRVTTETRMEIRQIAEDFRARNVDVGRQSYVFEVTGDEGKITAFIEQMRPFGIIETMRTGRIALTRGSNADIPSHVYHDGESNALEHPLSGVTSA
jgi:acetolactate synthase I/III small subunit